MAERKMKDSGIEWIGKIPEGWRSARLASLYSLRTTKVSDTDYPPLSVTMQGIVPQLDTAAKTNDHNNRKLVKKGDFAINSRSDRRGSCGISKYDGSVSLINTVLSPNEEMCPQFFDWLFHTTQFADEFYKWGHGIVDDLWTTGWQDMKKINVAVPPLAVQYSIADFLDAKCSEIDALATDIQSEIDTLEKYKKSIITEAVTKGLDKNVKMKDSGIEWIGKIPEHWKLTRLGFASVMQNGYVGPTQDILVENGERYIQSLHIKDGHIIFGNDFFVTKEWGDRHPKIHKGDILIVQTGDIGQVAVVDNEYDGCNCHALIICHVNNDEFVSQYLLYYLMSYAGNEELMHYQTGTTLKHLNSSKIKYAKIVMPTIDEQVKIVEFLRLVTLKIETAIKDKNMQLDVLAEYKKSLIYEYVTGKKEVPENE